MNKDDFLFTSKLPEIQKKFIKDGWITIYKKISGTFQEFIYCCIVTPPQLDVFLDKKEWGIYPGREGKPTLYASSDQNEEESRYHAFAEKGIEPFIFSRSFPHNHEMYTDISEDFVNYFKLYERIITKQNRTYFFIDDLGEAHEAIIVAPDIVKIKLKYLIEYISVRRVHFSISFEFMCVVESSKIDFPIEEEDKLFKTDVHHYSHVVRSLSLSEPSMQSWMLGKLLIRFDPSKVHKSWYDLDDQYEEFIIGYDDNGDEVSAPCNSDKYQFFTVVNFKKEVLSKYYANPGKYDVDGFHVKSTFFSLKMDNNSSSHVAVFLNDLRMLPYKEQLHWKQYNIAPDFGVSKSFYKTMIEGSWSEKPETLDLYFKDQYVEINRQWENKYGWPFFKELLGADAMKFKALHMPTTDNVVSFCDQVGIIVKCLIDALNEAKITEELISVEKEGGISKLERFIKSKGIELSDEIIFLRYLQDLRSGLIAHRFSENNVKVKGAFKYFSQEENNWGEMAKQIFIKSIRFIKAIEERLL